MQCYLKKYQLNSLKDSIGYMSKSGKMDVSVNDS